MAVYDNGAQPFSRSAGTFVNFAAATCSLALMVGVGIWSYELIKRDVSGIPVVRAVEGDMRVAPENPGGEIADHAGLSVNDVAAEGTAGEFEDTLLLAPRTQDLAAEDLTAEPETELEATSVSLTGEVAPHTRSSMTADAVLALADRIATGAAPLTELEDGTAVEPVLAIDGEAVEEELVLIAATVPGVSTSLRPFVRPASLRITAAAVDVDEAVAAALASATANFGPNNAEVSVMSADLPVGTNLAQLGAFPTPQAAAEVWASLEGEFGDYLVSKERVIQLATRGDASFYRLRAMGFTDLTDARRFCAALEAGKAECIPVVVR
ncbi:SPOR domain-containing protein [Cognatiyoonia sp.]|uniref:SPOR domain-containing protein n=1 Tax=Cognatiyoonia sp. TaxID=2211652 RepID=UPI003F69DCB9